MIACWIASCSVCRPCFRRWLLQREAPNARGSPRRRARDEGPGQAAWLPVMGAAQCPDPGIAFSGSEDQARWCLCPICSRRREARIVAARQPRSRPVSPAAGASFIIQGGVQTSEGVAQGNAKATQLLAAKRTYDARQFANLCVTMRDDSFTMPAGCHWLAGRFFGMVRLSKRFATRRRGNRVRNRLVGPSAQPRLTVILGGNAEPRQDEIWPQRVPSQRTDCSDVPHRTRSTLAVRCRPGSHFR